MSHQDHFSAAMAISGPNPAFRFQWRHSPATPRELDHAAEVEAAHGKERRAALLSWRAHQIRSGAKAAP